MIKFLHENDIVLRVYIIYICIYIFVIEIQTTYMKYCDNTSYNKY